MMNFAAWPVITCGRERVGHTLQPTALVNEAYLKLINHRNITWQNRAPFFSIAAQLMRCHSDRSRAKAYQQKTGRRVSQANARGRTAFMDVRFGELAELESVD
jgi:hypothetical protein